MDTKELESVIAVYKSKSFSEAAYQTSFSLSTISKHVKKVEDELGVILFERKTYSNSILPTDIGKYILPGIEKMIEDYQFVCKQVSLLKHETKDLTIACLPMMCQNIEDEIFSSFYANYAEIRVEEIITYSKDTIRGINSGAVDGAFMLFINSRNELENLFSKYKDEGIVVLPIYNTTNVTLGISEKHRLACQEAIDLRDLGDETFIFSLIQQPTNAPKYILDLMGKSENEISKRFMDFKRPNVVLNIVSSGQGVIPKIFPKEIFFPGVKFVPIKNWNKLSTFAFVYNRSNKSNAFDKFKRCVEGYLSTNSCY